MLLGTQRVNRHGHLEIGGCDTVKLARKYGTPLYVLDEDLVRENCRAFRRAFESRYPNVHISFSSKAFTTAAVCRIVDQEGLGVDVSSGGELHTALHAGVAPNRVFMHGSNKSRAEMEMAVATGVGRLGIDHLDEIDSLQEIAAQHGTQLDVLVRVAPGVTANTHTHIQTGKVDTKFGFSLAGGAAMEAVAKALQAPSLRLHGVRVFAPG